MPHAASCVTVPFLGSDADDAVRVVWPVCLPGSHASPVGSLCSAAGQMCPMSRKRVQALHQKAAQYDYSMRYVSHHPAGAASFQAVDRSQTKDKVLFLRHALLPRRGLCKLKPPYEPCSHGSTSRLSHLGSHSMLEAPTFPPTVPSMTFNRHIQHSSPKATCLAPAGQQSSSSLA